MFCLLFFILFCKGLYSYFVNLILVSYFLFFMYFHHLKLINVMQIDRKSVNLFVENEKRNLLICLLIFVSNWFLAVPYSLILCACKYFYWVLGLSSDLQPDYICLISIWSVWSVTEKQENMLLFHLL